MSSITTEQREDLRLLIEEASHEGEQYWRGKQPLPPDWEGFTDRALDILEIGEECRDCGRIDGGCDRDVETLAAQVERVRALHVEAHAIFLWSQGVARYESPCPDCHGAAGIHPCGCWGDVQVEYVCAECHRTASPKVRADVTWPCPTVRALDGEAYPAAPQMDDRLRAVTAERDRLTATIGQVRGLLSETINGRARWVDSVPEAIRLLGGEEA